MCRGSCDLSMGNDSEGYGTQPVATKAPNELGLYDMSGNVDEYCQDWFGSYSSDAQTNPIGPASGLRRVVRNGSWGSEAVDNRVSARGGNKPTSAWSFDGLRLALLVYTLQHIVNKISATGISFTAALSLFFDEL